jgi:putative methyltransferase (TIGR04325 family)
MTAADFRVFEGVYARFDEAPEVGDGFAGSIWRERSLKSARDEAKKLAAGEALDYSLRQRNAVLPVVVAMLLSRQARAKILDFGGGLGTAFMALSRAIGDDIARVDYHVVEVDGICRDGRELFSGRCGPTFEADLPQGGGFDVVTASSVLQYVKDWPGVVRRLAGYGALYLVLGDVFIGEFQSYVTLQNYYDSRIRHWFVNAAEFIGEIEKQGYTLLLRSPCDNCILGVYGPLPMSHFPQALQLPHASHLLFSKSGSPL